MPPKLPFRIALTFDAEHPDRPSTPGGQEQLLDLLDRLEVRGTFFIQGRWAQAWPATAARIAQAGHLVGNHSHYHVRMDRLDVPGLAHDIHASESVIQRITGVDPRPWFRCPFGIGATSRRVTRALKQAGYRHVGWTVDPQDWEPDRAAENLAASILASAFRFGRPEDEIVLLHTWPDRTVAGLPETVARLRDGGAELVRVDELATVTPIPGAGPTTVPLAPPPLDARARLPRVLTFDPEIAT